MSERDLSNALSGEKQVTLVGPDDLATRSKMRSVVIKVDRVSP